MTQATIGAEVEERIIEVIEDALVEEVLNKEHKESLNSLSNKIVAVVEED